MRNKLATKNKSQEQLPEKAIKGKNMKYILLLAGLYFPVFLSCDPAVSASFFIENQTDFTIKACYYLRGINSDKIGKDSSIIKSDSTACINSFSGIGQASEVRDNFSDYIDSVTILINDSLVYQQTPIDKLKWIADEHINSWSGGGSVTYTLKIDSLTIKYK
jgi:hypothetical protein